jgi:hypothetical protein
MLQKTDTGKTVSFTVPAQLSEFLAELAWRSSAPSLRGGCLFALEAFDSLYRELCREVRERMGLSEADVMLCMDALGSAVIKPGTIGQHVEADVDDGIRMDGLVAKWKTDGPAALRAKLHQASVGHLAAIEITALRWWGAVTARDEAEQARLVSMLVGKRLNMQQQKCIECGSAVVDVLSNTSDGWVVLARCRGCGCGQPVIASTSEELKGRVLAAANDPTW